ncbi:MAG: hypothetical protein V4726_01365 [Verrucomicrobiota bacterium]
MSAPPLLLILTAFLMSLTPVLRGAEEESPLKKVGLEERELKESVRGLLYESKFSELDKLAKQYNDKRERVVGGVWKLRHLSDGLAYPGKVSDDAEWKRLLEKLTEWTTKSDTAFPINALGHAQLNYAWNARGYKFAGGVKPENWPVFEEWVEKARGNLEKALEKDPGCVDVYRSLLHVGQSQGWERPQMEAMFQRGIKVVPDYFDNYYNMAFYLMERWHGQPGDCQRFLNSIPDLVPGDTGREIYTRAAMQIYWYYSDHFFGESDDRIYWRRMRKGFEVLNKKWPDIFFRNRFAFYAWAAGDEDTARRVVLELQEKNLLHAPAWYNQKNVDAVLKWLKLEARKPEEPVDPE